MLGARRMTVIGMVAVVVLSTAGVAQAEPTLTYSQLAAMAPGDQAATLDPLRAVANAAGAAGKGSESGIFSGIQIDAPTRTVTIYLTELTQQSRFLAAMQQIDLKVSLAPARFKQGGYPMTALIAAANKLALQQRRSNMSIESIAVNPDGSALTVRAYDVTLAKIALKSEALSSSVGSVPIVVEKTATSDLVALSRMRDSPDWISGAGLSSANTSQGLAFDCTMGLPARRNSDGVSFMISAAHCWGDGSTIYTGWKDGGRDQIGYVAFRDNWDDAAAIALNYGQTASQEWDGPADGAPMQNVYDVSGFNWSYWGDMVCQDGLSIGLRCGLLVTNGYIIWTDPRTNAQHAGVEAHQVDDLFAGYGGDSGGLVFALVDWGREARGIVSARWNDTYLRFTEAPAIFSAMGMDLAPG